jgi:hypothetical protein
MRRRSLAVGAVAALAATLTTACGEVDPIGSVDWAVGGVESVTVAGWAWDQDRGEAPTTLHVYVDGAYRLSGVTTVARPDVGALYPGSGETRGYGLTVSVAPGSHEVCVYAINEGEGTTNPLLGCKAATATAAAPPVATDGTIRVDSRAYLGFGPEKWGTNASFFLHPSYLNAQLAARGSEATGFMRFPGGIAAQDWRWASCELSASPGAVTYGTPCYPADKRNLATDPLLKTSEFFKWVNTMGPQRLVLTLNANATMQENAALVAFTNGSPSDTRVIGVDQHGVDWHTVGFWAQKRVDAGVAEPMDVTLWEFGNETFGGKGGTGCVSYGWETVWTCNSVEFYDGVGAGAARHNGYAETKSLLKSIDSSIQLGIPASDGELNPSNPWTQPLIDHAGASIDFLVMHVYYQYAPPADTPEGNATILAFPQTKLSALETHLRNAENAAGVSRRIPVLMSEYGLTSSGWEEREGQRISQQINALMVSDSIGQMGVNERFIGSNQFTMYYDYSFGNEFGMMGFKDENYSDAYRYPTYYAMALWKRFGTSIKDVSTTFDRSSTLSVYAGQKNGRTTLMVINKTNSPQSATISVDGATIVSERADTFVGSTIHDTLPTFNGKVVPADDLSDAPGTTTDIGAASSYVRSFPGASITLIELTTQP